MCWMNNYRTVVVYNVLDKAAVSRGRNLVGRRVTNLGAVLIETLKADPLREGYTRDTSRLSAGDVVEASREKILGYLGGLPAARVPCHHDHRVASHQLHYPVPVLVDGQALLLPAELGQLSKTLSLAEVQEMQESQAAVGDLLAARTRGSLPASVLRRPQALLHIPGAHGHVDAVTRVVVFRKAEVYLSRASLCPVFAVPLCSCPRHFLLGFKPLEAVKKRPELFVLRASRLDVVMSAEKDLVQLGSALRAVPVPTAAVPPSVGVHVLCQIPYSPSPHR